MVEIVSGDLFEADVDAITNAVNCVGAMGRGIALAFKQRFPDNFVAYKQACDAGSLRPGSVLVFDRGESERPRYIVNFPTKDHWRNSSKLADIEAGLQALTHEIDRLRIRSVALPALGCGLGGLEWETVRNAIETTFRGKSAVQVSLYSPI
ncbi:macro domain-containing protein [Rhodopirellula sallentina]|uniref:Appr-1-p processing domain-containing protein n=1 Tax=Rhodopirellula sallentina SM41 TaxID=1263870 RepID=M5U0G8_9BACT|nr:macro domain-containing protein [Rhodopirellula sallentina]EMI54950.1 appr-1-p processing domain-containing protein [Rhodopirellula sallentina SM41]